MLGLCPVLAVTTTAENGIGMGIATTFVLLCSNVLVSLLRNIIPQKIRIACFITIIATFVTVVEFLMKAYTYELFQTLGIFIPLIVVNCVVLGRAEAFACKNGVAHSLADGLGIGLGFTLSLGVLGAFREALGAGTIFGTQVFGDAFQPFTFMVEAPGAFLGLGILLCLMNIISSK